MNWSIFGAADARLLPEGRVTGPMPWVIAIMMFLTVLAAAAGLGLGSAAQRLDGGNRITVQIVEADPIRRETQARAVLAELDGAAGIASVRRVPDHELHALLEPWLGSGGLEDIEVPAMIEAELGEGANLARMGAIIASAAPSAQVDDNGQWLAPLERLISALRWLAMTLVLLMAAATAATVILAARAALDTHRATIEVLHLMGATDHQVARLFQQRIALDALFGGLIGLAAAVGALALIGQRVSELGSELIGSAALSPSSWIMIGTLPLLCVLLAMLVARVTILRALSQLL
ncbi:MAG: FtsX-like permease family protein [Sphingosinicella sp.]|nr:FtsX-like permease family protein [Sphingosinicella sp.]